MTARRFVEVTDHDGHTIHLDAARVVYIRSGDPGRYHDHGSVTLDTGANISFCSDDGPRRLLQQLEALHAEGQPPPLVGWGDKREKSE